MGTNCKIAICFLAYLAFSGLSSVSGAQWNGGYEQPTDTIESVGGMTPKMEDDAATLLKADLATDKPWVTLRDTSAVTFPAYFAFTKILDAMTPRNFIEIDRLMTTQKTAE